MLALSPVVPLPLFVVVFLHRDLSHHGGTTVSQQLGHGWLGATTTWVSSGHFFCHLTRRQRDRVRNACSNIIVFLIKFSFVSILRVIFHAVLVCCVISIPVYHQVSVRSQLALSWPTLTIVFQHILSTSSSILSAVWIAYPDPLCT